MRSDGEDGDADIPGAAIVEDDATKRTYSEVTESVMEEGSLAKGLEVVKRIIYCIQARLGAVTGQLDTNDVRSDTLTNNGNMNAEATKAAADKMKDPKKRMITGIDLRDNAARNGQKNNDVELSRIKKLMGLEGIDVESLLAIGRYGTKLAAKFLTPLGRRAGVLHEFKKIKFDGRSRAFGSKASKRSRGYSERADLLVACHGS